jgi:hypothetical protein
MKNEPVPNRQPGTATPLQTGHGAHGGHGWMMMICCIPMIVIAIVLVAAGVASPSFLLAAGACTAMMALMMRGMDHGAGHDHNREGGPS